ncbi:MAG: Flp pilus assembly protein CpaB [Actinomycetota bacterium]
MRRKRPLASKVLLVLALVVGVGATLELRGYLAGLEAQASPPEMATILVAAVDLPRGVTLEADMLRTTRIPIAYAPPGVLSKVDEAIGLVLLTDLLTGEPLTPSRLSRGGPIAALVPDGLRAIAVTVPMPAGALAPGDRVDLFATYAAGNPHTEAVATDLEVLRIVESSIGELGEATSLLLLVSPETAERIAFARAFADLSLAIVPVG